MLEELHKSFVPSSFEKGKELVHDEPYRSACELQPDRFTLNIPDSLELIQAISPPISTFFGNPVRAELYKLNSYATEGFFGAHRDTAKGEDHIGTLVVCLPCGFTGGKLIVKHKDNEYAFDWADKSSELVQWAFFLLYCSFAGLEGRNALRIPRRPG
jgi:hypothetical protein